MMYIMFLLGFYLGGLLIGIIGVHNMHRSDPLHSKTSITLVMCLLAWPVTVPISEYYERKKLKT